ncbi:RNA polymerase factor sigma-54 [Candidatus Formimonas warabiya]|uniref:RNA polymerase sigma-54 factor n=1 Tax=Formimonas warabiya TaxID=1761012 RepID=A0A3G1KTV3_FORW1|nr:RNA polymerase factor sigma-54 [Candidatus Formimonas warabiya]ATW25892.1 RNA polymerase sigma-54 factor [Candidatus Formimonas warabiya]
MEPKLILEQSQKLIMTPELKQAITVLTLPALELTNYIQQQLEENPVLELPEGLAGESDLPGNEDGSPDLKELFADSSDLGLGPGISRERKETVFEPVAVQHSSLQDYLKFQLHIIKLTPQQSRIGEYIIDNINHEGYLTTTIPEIAEAIKVNTSDITDLLTIIKTFDPSGVGASNLGECLELQLDPSDPRYELLVELIENHLDDIAANRLVLVAKSLKISLKETQDLVSAIKTLDPKPGLQYAEEKSVEYILPDVVIERVGNEYVVLVNDTTVPRLNINSYYRNLVRNDLKVDDSVRKFVEGKLNSAVWLIRSIEQRRITLYKVASAVVEYQREFLDKGIAFLVPLTLKEIAEKVGVHESTVSRAISSKYVQTPRGTFSWKFFFASGIVTSEGDAASANWIKKMIQDFISAENPNQPLSDQKLTDLLQGKGINISRRTVAKYREDLSIPSSSKRKRY